MGSPQASRRRCGHSNLNGHVRLALVLLAVMLGVWGARGTAPAGATPAFEAFVEVSDPTSSSVELQGNISQPGGLETQWRFEMTSSETGPWQTVPGASGTVSAAQASDQHVVVGFHATGLQPGTTYYVRFAASNVNGEALSNIEGFRTAGPPSELVTFATHALDGENVRGVGALNLGGSAVNELQSVTFNGATGGTFTLTVNGETTKPIEFNPRETAGEKFEMERIAVGLRELSSVEEGGVFVYGGPTPDSYVVEFVGLHGGTNIGEMTANPSGLSPSGATVTVKTLQDGGPFEVEHGFEYVSQEQFEANGWLEANHTTMVPLQAGPAEFQQVDGHRVVLSETQVTGADILGLTPGETYHYRLVASSPLGSAHGTEQAVTVSVPGRTEDGGEAPSPTQCPNEGVRVGLSGALPDCRAYELVTPPDKQGAMDIFGFAQLSPTTALVGEDGEHVLVDAQSTKWGTSTDSVNSSYFFSRAAAGWQMTPGTPQPLARQNSYSPSLFDADLAEIAVQIGWSTGTFTFSPEAEFSVGPPGGPYTPPGGSQASPLLVPRADRTEWVGASPDFSRLILASEDRSVCGRPTATTVGLDLYEFAEGQCRQVNVQSNGSPIGTCGASIAKTIEGSPSVEGGSGGPGGHAVSADGSDVFFEAVPGGNCGEPSHVYVREHGATTQDLGAYSQFIAVNAAGTEAMLLRHEGEQFEYWLYDARSKAATLLFSSSEEAKVPLVSSEFKAFYFRSKQRLTSDAPTPSTRSEDAGGDSPENVYRYDILAKSLRFVIQSSNDQGSGGGTYTSPNGRYYYWASVGVAGVFREASPKGSTQEDTQVYRYDNASNVVECLSCASSFDPHPKVSSLFLPPGGNGLVQTADAVPNRYTASANGDYVFFDSTSRLVPRDSDEEIPPSVYPPYDNHDFYYSVSSDVYEWLKDGIHGCTHVQGCLALITPGTGGMKNMLLGTTPSGEDVFIATHAALVGQDLDKSSDVYDVRVDGGYPPPVPPPVECAGDACVNPYGGPLDTTPASLSFSGPGNTLTPSLGTTVGKTAKRAKRHAKLCAKRRARHKSRCVRRKSGKRRGKSTRRARRGPGAGNGGGR